MGKENRLKETFIKGGNSSTTEDIHNCVRRQVTVMIYDTKEFLYIRVKARNSSLQRFKTTTDRFLDASLRPKREPAVGTSRKNCVLWPYLQEYCITASIHCLHYFASKKLRCYEKLIWFFIMLTMSVCCVIVYCDLAELYSSQSVQTTVVDSVHPIFVLPFPSVGICMRNRVDWHRFHNEGPNRFLPPNADNRTLNTFFAFFESLADIKFYNLERSAKLLATADNVDLTLIDGVNVLEVLQYFTYSCEQVFPTPCFWRYKSYNCCELLALERTEMGFCFTFNSAISKRARERAENDPFYPYHNSYSGEGSGLELNILLHENKISPEAFAVNGVYIMVKKNDEWNADGKFINHNTFTKVALTAQLTETDKRIRNITPVKRGCLFEDETRHILYKKLPGLSYWRGNCRSRCHQEYVIKYCKCNLNLFFPDHISDNFTSCKPSDFNCIYEHANLFSRETQLFESKYIHDVTNDSMVCNCLNSCHLLWYHAFYTSFPLERFDSPPGTQTIHLDIHYQTSTVLKYRTAMRYTLVELLANFGGIIGLFLGASLLSAVELIYYLTIGLYIHLRNRLPKIQLLKSRKSLAKPQGVKISFIDPRQMYKH